MKGNISFEALLAHTTTSKQMPTNHFMAKAITMCPPPLLTKMAKHRNSNNPISKWPIPISPTTFSGQSPALPGDSTTPKFLSLLPTIPKLNP